MKVQVRRLLNKARMTAQVFDVYHACMHMLEFNVHRENRRFTTQWAADMLPLPPPKLIFRVTGQYKVEPFLENGLLGVECIKAALAKNGLAIEDFRSILDFGCGCGRIMRHWRTDPRTQFYGTDYNAALIDWCRSALAPAQFSVNSLHGKLDYEDEQFDFIYTISVFTHLDAADQQLWMDELFRVLKPGGFIYLTVHGFRESKMTPEERQRFDSGDHVVIGEQFTGHNACMVFSPEAYVRNVLAKKFIIADFIPVGAKDAGQDVYLLRKPLLS